MILTLQYSSSFETLREACVLFIEQKPFMRFMIQSFNIMGYLLLLIYALKAYEVGLAANEYAMIGLILMWVFYRVRFNRWLIGKRLKDHPLVKHLLTVKISNHDIQWQCESLAGQTSLKKLKRVLCLNDGFILMTHTRQYLWIPSSAFTTDQKNEFITTLKNAKVKQSRLRKKIT